MVLTEYNKSIPDWLYENINKQCPYCGAHIADDGPDGNNGQLLLTQRYCINPSCPGHLQHRIDILAKRFNVKGFGPETGLSFAKSYHYKNHLQILQVWFPDYKPKIHLWEVGDLSMIYGLSGTWKEYTMGYRSFQEMFDNADYLPRIIRANKNYLFYCETFFDIKAPLSKDVVNIMISGSIDNFSNRKQFVETMNDTFGKWVQIIDVKKRISDVACLVKEPYSSDHEKTSLAESNGIPILSSREFIIKIAQKVTYKREKEKQESEERSES
jgi:hypothetical protein